MLGLILCAGNGTRMKPLTNVLPKPLLPIEGKPVIAHTIEAMQEHNFDRVGLVIKEEDFSIFQKFLDKYFPQIEIDIFVQYELTGIITAIRSADDYVDERILACAGDTKFDYAHIEPFIEKQDEADIIIGITKRSVQEIVNRSNIIINQDNQVIETIEKPRKEQIESHWSGVPIWMFDKQMWTYFPKSKKSSNNEYAVEGVIKIANENRDTILAVKLDGTEDITYPADILYRNFDYISEMKFS